MLGLLRSFVIGALIAGCSSGTSQAQCDDPVIDLWYGDVVRAGAMGHPQRQVNVLGRVSSSGGVAELRASLDGAPFEPVAFAPGGSDRLGAAGDFNVEFDRATLRDGQSELVLEAESTGGAVCARTVVIEHDPAAVWPTPYAASFGGLGGPADIDRQVAIVDGLWEATPDGIHVVERGYDRLLAVGDVTWPPVMDATAVVTVHSINNWGGIGIAVGWQGHEGDEEPPADWPVGALGWVRNKTEGSVLELITFGRGGPSTPLALDHGQTYTFRLRAEPVGPDRVRAEVKVWPTSGPEPAEWMVSDEVAARPGSLLLVAHNADLTWREISVNGAPVGSTDSGLEMPPPGGGGDAGGGGIDSGSDLPDAGGSDVPAPRGCAVTGSPASPWPLALLLLAFRRRRQ